MQTGPSFRNCLAFIQCQLQPDARVKVPANGQARWRAVTISRQSGAGGHVVSMKLAEFLQTRVPGKKPWTIFDRELVAKVLEDHQLPARLAQFMPEDRVSEMSNIMEELLGVHPPTWTLIEQTTETILQLAELGNVILIGRGANVITAKLDSVFHVRLVSSLDKRCEYIQEIRKVGKKAALQFIHDEDRGRRRYLKKYFGKDIGDPLLYHLTVNTDLLSHTSAAELIGRTILSGNQAKPST